MAYPNTEGQQRQRSWFIGMVRFAAQAKAALKLGYRQPSLKAGMTEGNYFVMRNKQCFERKGEAVVVDYEHLALAEGPAADVYFHSPKFLPDEVVSVDFERNALQLRASGDDSVYLFAYAEGLGQGLLSAPVRRRDKRLGMRLPEGWAGQVVHLYGFVVDREGRASRSTYIGVGMVNHEMQNGRYIPVNNSWLEFVDMANRTNALPPATEAGSRPDSGEAEQARPEGVP